MRAKAPSVQGRTSGVRGLLTYVSITKCAIRADQRPDDAPVDLEPHFICGHRGTDVRPDFDWERPQRRGALSGAKAVLHVPERYRPTTRKLANRFSLLRRVGRAELCRRHILHRVRNVLDQEELPGRVHILPPISASRSDGHPFAVSVSASTAYRKSASKPACAPAARAPSRRPESEQKR